MDGKGDAPGRYRVARDSGARQTTLANRVFHGVTR